MRLCDECHGGDLADGERCGECEHVQGTPTTPQRRIAELEAELRAIKDQSAFKQADKWGYDRGYRQAQLDIRQALGVNET